MAQQKRENGHSFDHILKLVDALGPEDRGRLYTHLQFRFWDEEWKKARQRLDEERAARGLPPASDEDVHDAVDAMRKPEDWAELRHEIQRGIDQLDRGEGIPADKVFAELRKRNQVLKEKDKN